MTYIPQDDETRKAAPMFRGLLGYFPAALFEVAAHSLDSDRKHNGENPDGPHWARGKSADHEDTILRHLIDAGPRREIAPGVVRFSGPPPKGSSALDTRRYHLRCIAWRALALLQEDCEADGATPGVSSVFPSTVEQIREKIAAAAEERKLYPETLHPAQQLAIDAFRREQQPKRWGVFRGDELIHGYLTVLESERDARLCPQAQWPGRRVAPIEPDLGSPAGWKETK